MLDPANVKSLATYNVDTLLSLCADHATGRVYAGSVNYGLYVFDLAAEKKEPVVVWKGHDNYVSALALVDSPAGKWVVSGGYDRRLLWWDAASGNLARTVEAHQGWIRDLAVFPDASRLASVADDMVVKLWDAQTGELIRAFEGHAQRTPQGHVTALYVVAVSPDGKLLASGDRIGEVRVWEVETGSLVQTFQVPVLYTYDPVQRKRSIGGIRSLAFSPDGARLAVGGIGQVNNVDGLEGPATIELWDWQSPKALFAGGTEGHKAIINSLAFHPSEPWLIGGGGGSDNGLVAFWKTDPLPSPPAEAEKDKPPTVEAVRVKCEGHVHRILLSPDATRLYAAGHGKLEVWGLSYSSS